MGHAVRCAHLAKALRDAGEDVVMWVQKDEPTKEYFEAMGLDTIPVIRRFSKSETKELSFPASRDRLIVDLMLNDDTFLRSTRPVFEQLVVIVGVGYTITRDTHWIADQVIYQAPTPRWNGVPGEDVTAGLDHMIIDPQYAEEPENNRELDAVCYLGGGIGPSEKHIVNAALNKDAAIDWKYLDNWPGGAFEDMSRARLFVGSMGVTVYEALAAGTYPIVICRSEDHAIPARRLASQQRITFLGLAEEINAELLTQTISNELLLRSIPQPRSIDGLGVYRVADKILSWKPRRS
jgi:spore coat polysaccharide biosynthesis predicted glycosyltransferase SpsG